MKGRKKMNGKEAIEVLKMHRPFGLDDESERIREAIDRVIPLVELRIPKEPIDFEIYRKCIVTIPAIERYMGRNAAGELQKEVLKEAETQNAVFHRWVDEQYKVPVYRNGQCQYSSVLALVEYEDGTVHRVEPEYIKFVER